MEFNPIIEILDKITIVFGTITMCGVFYNIWQNRKNSITKNDKISKKDIAIWKRCVYTLNDRNKEL